MNTLWKAPPNALDRLEQAIERLCTRPGYRRLLETDLETDAADEISLLLLTDDPQRNPEVLDALVILPEALKNVSSAPICRVADPRASAALQQRYAVARCPALLLLQGGRSLGSILGIFDWSSYQQQLSALLEKRPVAIDTTGRPV